MEVGRWRWGEGGGEMEVERGLNNTAKDTFPLTSLFYLFSSSEILPSPNRSCGTSSTGSAARPRIRPPVL